MNPPDLNDFVAKLQRFRAVIAGSLEEASPAEQARLQPLVAEMEKQFAVFAQSYPQAVAGLQSTRGQIVEGAKKSEDELARLRQAVAEGQKQRAAAAQARTPTPAPVTVDEKLGQALRSEILNKFGKSVGNVPPSTIGDVREMESEEFQQFSSQHMPIPKVPDRVDSPGHGIESTGDMRAASLSDFEDGERKKQPGKPQRQERPGEIEGLPEELWEDRGDS